MLTPSGSIRNEILFQPVPDTTVSEAWSRPDVLLVVPFSTRNSSSTSRKTRGTCVEPEDVAARESASGTTSGRKKNRALDPSAISISGATKNSKKKELSKPLPEHFEPTPYTVIVGRNSEAKDNLGNKRLRVLASNYLSAYSAAQDRRIKTEIVNEIQKTILMANGNFVVKRKGVNKNDSVRWYHVSDAVAREKIGYVLRDLLSHKYKSSSKSKVEKKRLLKLERASSSKQDSHPFLFHLSSHASATIPSCRDSTSVIPSKACSSFSPVSTTVDIDLSAEDCVIDDATTILPPLVVANHFFCA